tara:strand:- start:610 stop:1497 length:888 start_codon:yes stop_codon:yes gene_type:complete
MKPKIVFLGGSSLLSINWVKSILNSWDVFLFLNKRMVNIEGTESVKFVYPIENSLQAQLEKISPRVIINCVALTNIEKCQNEKEKAEYANVKFPSIVAKISENIGSKLVHISTDHLFKGDNSFYSENATLSPQNYYAETKARAENIVLDENKKSLVIRTNFFGWGTFYRESFSDFIIKNLQKKKQIKLFKDVFFTPIYIDELIRLVHDLIERNEKGIFNVVSSERLSKYDFGLKIAKILSLPAYLISPTPIGAFETLIKRPLDMSLSNLKLKNLIGCKIKSLDEQIMMLKNSYRN